MKIATIASSILATTFVALGGAALPSVAAASPVEGMVCRAGYTGALSNGHFVCSKTKVINVALECTNRLFPKFVVRAPGAAGDSSGGRDLCTRAQISVGSTDPLTGLVQNQDFIFASVNPTTVNTQIANNDAAEAQSLGLNAADVVTTGSTPSLVVNGGFGSNDIARVTLTFNTFAIPALGVISLPPGLPSLPTLPRLP